MVNFLLRSFTTNCIVHVPCIDHFDDAQTMFPYGLYIYVIYTYYVILYNCCAAAGKSQGLQQDRNSMCSAYSVKLLAMTHAIQAEKLIGLFPPCRTWNPKPKKAGLLDIEFLDSAARARRYGLLICERERCGGYDFG